MNSPPRVTNRIKARIAGTLYVTVIITAGFAEAIARGRLIVRADPAATSANILSHQALYRLGGAADLVNIACDVLLTLILYQLLKPVSKTISQTSAAFELLADSVLAVATLAHFAALLFLITPDYRTAFTLAQLQAQAFAYIRLHNQGYNIAMVFYGCRHMLLGYLVYCSADFSRTVGMGLCIAGVCYSTNALARCISPAFASHLYPYILWPGILAEAMLALSLLFGRFGQPLRTTARPTPLHSPLRAED
ncbi:MAG TPA: DUF4386 domain-containing protein [Gemmatimonadaceae bacterium]|nr:DUF4386 domain-containing protein [Gemmatimonadaceae bacterium]